MCSSSAQARPEQVSTVSCVQVACTCLSTHSPLLGRRTFDVCIVDEASQITLPATLGALLRVRPWNCFWLVLQLHVAMPLRPLCVGKVAQAAETRLSTGQESQHVGSAFTAAA